MPPVTRTYVTNSISNIEFHENGTIKSIGFTEHARASDVAMWMKFANHWSSKSRTEALKLLEESSTDG